MRISFTLTPHSTFIVSAISGDRVVYAEEHSWNDSLLDVVNAIRKDQGIPALFIGSKVSQDVSGSDVSHDVPRSNNPNAKEG